MIDINSNEPNIYNLFGLSISNIDLNSIKELSSKAISKQKKILIGYINPHIARYAQKNESLIAILNTFSFNHIDGIGMELAARLFIKHEKFTRLNWTWTDDAFRYMEECEKRGWKIFLLGSDEKTLNEAKAKILISFPDLQFAGCLNGYDGINESTVKVINESGPDILWVGLGSLRQESWIINNHEKLNCYVIQSVGDLYSEIAGKRLRGPMLMRKLGLEWLFRIIQHPIKYFDRYVIGIPYFFFLILIYKFNGYKKISSKI